MKKVHIIERYEYKSFLYHISLYKISPECTPVLVARMVAKGMSLELLVMVFF